MSRRLVYRLVYVPSLIALVGLVAAFAHPTHSHSAPVGMKTYEAADHAFSIARPADWHTLSSNQNGTGSKVRIQRDANSEVVVTCDLSGSLMLDLSRNGNPLGANFPGMEGSGGGAFAAQKTPLESAHEFGAAHLKGEFQHYVEQPAKPSVVGGHEALVSAFTAQTADMLNSHAVVGKRITVLAGNRPVTFDAFCPKGEENDFYPTVDAMLKTLSVSETGG